MKIINGQRYLDDGKNVFCLSQRLAGMEDCGTTCQCGTHCKCGLGCPCPEMIKDDGENEIEEELEK